MDAPRVTRMRIFYQQAGLREKTGRGLNKGLQD